MKVVKVTMRIIPLHHKKRVKIQTQQKARNTMKTPTTSQEKSKNENTEQENDETDEILKKPLDEMNTEEKRALFKKMQQGDE